MIVEDEWSHADTAGDYRHGLLGAEDLDEFWRLIVGGRSAVGPLPADRLDRELYFDPRKGIDGKTYSDIGAVVRYGPFDGRKCLLPEEAVATADVGHLTGCEVAVEACRAPKYLRRKRPPKLASRRRADLSCVGSYRPVDGAQRGLLFVAGGLEIGPTGTGIGADRDGPGRRHGLLPLG